MDHGDRVITTHFPARRHRLFSTHLSRLALFRLISSRARSVCPIRLRIGSRNTAHSAFPSRSCRAPPARPPTHSEFCCATLPQFCSKTQSSSGEEEDCLALQTETGLEKRREENEAWEWLPSAELVGTEEKRSETKCRKILALLTDGRTDGRSEADGRTDGRTDAGAYWRTERSELQLLTGREVDDGDGDGGERDRDGAELKLKIAVQLQLRVRVRLSRVHWFLEEKKKEREKERKRKRKREEERERMWFLERRKRWTSWDLELGWKWKGGPKRRRRRGPNPNWKRRRKENRKQTSLSKSAQWAVKWGEKREESEKKRKEKKRPEKRKTRLTSRKTL
jgi:hypothetical protein